MTNSRKLQTSAQARRTLDRANKAVDAALESGNYNAYLVACEAANEALDAFKRTPAGIKAIRARGADALADKYQAERNIALFEARLARADEDFAASEGVYSFPSRVNSRTGALFGKHACFCINLDYTEAGHADTLTVPREIVYTSGRDNAVLRREVLLDTTARTGELPDIPE